MSRIIIIIIIITIGADPFGFPTLVRPWDDGSDTIENAERRLRANFEFLSKLGVKYWAFHDRYGWKYISGM